MVRFLLAAAVVFALFSVGFGFFNRSKLANLSQELGEALQRTQQSQDQVKDLQVTLKQTEERLTTQEKLTQQERDNRNTEFNATKAKLNQVTDQLNARDNENKALTAALTEAAGRERSTGPGLTAGQRGRRVESAPPSFQGQNESLSPA